MCGCRAGRVIELQPGRQFTRIGRLVRNRQDAGVAQLVERFTCNEDVGGSTPLAGSSYIKGFLISGSLFYGHGSLKAYLTTKNASEKQTFNSKDVLVSEAPDF